MAATRDPWNVDERLYRYHLALCRVKKPAEGLPQTSAYPAAFSTSTKVS